MGRYAWAIDLDRPLVDGGREADDFDDIRSSLCEEVSFSILYSSFGLGMRVYAAYLELKIGEHANYLCVMREYRHLLCTKRPHVKRLHRTLYVCHGHNVQMNDASICAYV